MRSTRNALSNVQLTKCLLTNRRKRAREALPYASFYARASAVINAFYGSAPGFACQRGLLAKAAAQASEQNQYSLP